MSEIAHTFRGIERPNMRSDTSLQSVDCALRSLAQECLEGVEDQLYRVKVRRILRQVAEICASSADRLPYTSETLWKDTLSTTTRSLRWSVGTRHCSM